MIHISEQLERLITRKRKSGNERGKVGQMGNNKLRYNSFHDLMGPMYGIKKTFIKK